MSVALRLMGFAALGLGGALFWAALFAAAFTGPAVGALGILCSVCLVGWGLVALEASEEA